MKTLCALALVLFFLPGNPALADTRTLTVNYALGAEYYSFKENGTMGGTLVDLLRAVLEEDMGLPCEHKGYPWRRAQEMVMRGSADALCTVPTPGRQKYMAFSREPLLTTRITVIYKTDNPKARSIAAVSSLDDLAPYSIVDHMGDQWAEKTLAPRFDVHWARTVQEAMLLLGEGRYDVMVAVRPEMDRPLNETMIRHGLTNKDLGDIRGPAFHLGLRKNYPGARKILDDFDRSVRRLRQNGRLWSIVSRTMF